MSNRPWEFEIPLKNGAVLKCCHEYVFVEDYLFDGYCSFGTFDFDDECYVMSDGDGHDPEDIADHGSRVHFFGDGIMTEILTKHFEKKGGAE